MYRLSDPNSTAGRGVWISACGGTRRSPLGQCPPEPPATEPIRSGRRSRLWSACLSRNWQSLSGSSLGAAGCRTMSTPGRAAASSRLSPQHQAHPEVPRSSRRRATATPQHRRAAGGRPEVLVGLCFPPPACPFRAARRCPARRQDWGRILTSPARGRVQPAEAFVSADPAAMSLSSMWIASFSTLGFCHPGCRLDRRLLGWPQDRPMVVGAEGVVVESLLPWARPKRVRRNRVPRLHASG